MVLFPGTAVPLRVGRAHSMAAVEKARLTNGPDGQLILTVAQKGDGEGEPGPADLYKVGTLSKLERIRGEKGQGFQVVVRAVSRFRLDDIREVDGRLEASGEILKDKLDADDKTAAALLDSLKKLSTEVLELLPAETGQLEELVRGIDDLGYLTNLASGNLEVPLDKKQALLETVSVRDRVLRLLEHLAATKDQLEVQSEIREKLSHKMGKHQREAILREQLRTIREELGEGGAASGEGADDLRRKIEAAGMPADVRKTAETELKRLETIGAQSPESHVIRSYLESLVAMPWSRSADASPAALDLERARQTLERDHYGLDKVKKRVLQSLAVLKMTALAAKDDKPSRGTVLLFVGPPGVGKTSLGQSIAEALGRKFVRVSLGGVRDDAEIRGHRRTYIGAMPGRIVQGIKRAGENNPVMMLDEIDKLGRGYSGDPAAALLEVLDPAQNSTFADHYLDVPFDLSKTFFIATANSLESIPGPLLDRMEVIELSGYTTAEKLHIAKNHLVPKQLAEHGLAATASGVDEAAGASGRPASLAIDDEAILRVISHYTREAGVRELERRIAALCRSSVERVLTARDQAPGLPGSRSPVRVSVADLEEALGPERFVHEVAERIAPPGVVTGLAWTPMGGEILFIEAGLMPGTGRLTLTGQLGDVMKESAQIALSLVRSRLSAPGSHRWTTPGFEFDKRDVHIHVPAGAIPKDGPSAGITMLTTIASLFSGRSVSPRLAMTGEVTLRGAVMPVGGIKEKVIAAHRAGIERVILSRRNERDLKEVPEEVRSALKFDFVDNVAEVLKIALGLELDATAPGLAPASNAGAAPVAVASSLGRGA